MGIFLFRLVFDLNLSLHPIVTFLSYFPFILKGFNLLLIRLDVLINELLVDDQTLPFVIYISADHLLLQHLIFSKFYLVIKLIDLALPVLYPLQQMVLFIVLVILQLRRIFNFLRLLFQFKGEHVHYICFLVELILLVFQLLIRVLTYFFEPKVIILVTVLLLKELELRAF
jgi:hypothetical protein